MVGKDEGILRTIKNMELPQLESNQWRLFNPKQPSSSGLRWYRVLDLFTFGKIARGLLKGRFPGGPRITPGTMYHSQEWFRLAAHSIEVRLTPEGLFQRAINGTINAGPELKHAREYLGFDANGHQIRYDFSCALIDLEVVLQRWPPYPKASVLQGIIVAKAIKATDLDTTPYECQLALKLINQAVGMIQGGLLSEARISKEYLQDCLGR